jgi:hypothetical protein
MPPAPIINAHNPNIVFLHGRRTIALQLPQDRVVADRHAKPMHQVLTPVFFILKGDTQNFDPWAG